jgi:hypothetical protein
MFTYLVCVIVMMMVVKMPYMILNPFKSLLEVFECNTNWTLKCRKDFDGKILP